MDKEKVKVYVEDQKRSIRTSLVKGKDFDDAEIENAIETTVKKIIEL